MRILRMASNQKTKKAAIVQPTALTLPAAAIQPTGYLALAAYCCRKNRHSEHLNFDGLHETISRRSPSFFPYFLLGRFQPASQHMYGFVVGFERHGKWVAILAAESERKTCWIGKPRGRSVDNFGNKGQRLESPGPSFSNSSNDAKS